MAKLILNNNYMLKTDNSCCPKKISRVFNKPYQFIKKNETKLLFNNGDITFTLWNNEKFENNYTCYLTFEKNNKFRITKHQLNENSVYLWVKICDIQLLYLQSYSCVRNLETFLFTVDFYNKINIKKNLRKVPSITKVFQNTDLVKYISEFLPSNDKKATLPDNVTTTRRINNRMLIDRIMDRVIIDRRIWIEYEHVYDYDY